MSNMINYGIDLGTTNSVIAKFIKGEVEIYKDQIDWKETFPSVVGFKKSRILVGSKAKEFLEKDPKNVIGKFKRRMGTTETYKIKSLNQSKTPVELSAYILKELKTFVPSKEHIDAVVITIPASFDTIQSNATKKAGYEAGFTQVELLQEPIAASLAFANKHKEKELSDGQWIVYDLGGGTFDVALVKILNGEMKIIDHEGNNFLGGADFDELILDKIVIPYLEDNYSFSDLKNEMKSNSGKYNTEYYVILRKCEEAKISLSSKTSAEIEFDIEDNDGDEHEISINITRSEFEEIIKELVDSSVLKTKEILVKNSLLPSDIQFLLMVGGSTYIPYVRNRVEETLEIPVNCSIDPTTAIAIGSAYYAGTREKKLDRPIKDKREDVSLYVKMAYQKTSQEDEELFAARFEGDISNLYYRITREDGGFDTGLKEIKNKITEDLPLVKNSFNFFKLTIFDKQNKIIDTNAELIGIAQGKYNVAGQPLPSDICIEVDDIERQRTKIERLPQLQKNAILPLKAKTTRILNRNILKGSDDEFIIKILEGPYTALPEANLTIGFMSITGKQLKRDIVKGADVEITLDISESRDLKISAYIPMADQEFTGIFKPIERHITVEWLIEEVNNLGKGLENEIEEATEREDYEIAGELNKLKKEASELINDSLELTHDDVTDKKFQLEDQKRKLAQEIDNATKDKRISIEKNKYLEIKEKCREVIECDGNDYELKAFNDIVSQENVFLNSISTRKIEDKIEELNTIRWAIWWRIPKFQLDYFEYLENNIHRCNDQEQAKNLLEAGKNAIASKDFDRLGDINGRILALLPDTIQKDYKSKIGFE